MSLAAQITGFKPLNIGIHAVLFTSELFHFIAHGKVLLGIGKPYSENTLYRRKHYFAWDRGSTFLSLLSLLPTLLRAPRKSSNLAIIAIAVAQYFQHTYYIRGWDAKAPHVKEIVEWSAVATNGERVKKFGWERHMGHYLATGFDMSVHGMMVLLQLAWLGEN